MEEEGFGAKGETGHLVRARRTSQGGTSRRRWTQEGALLGVWTSWAGTRKPHSGLEGPSCCRTLLKFSSHVASWPMHARRRASLGEAETVFWLFSDEALGRWFGLPCCVTDDGVLMDALRETLSRRIRLGMGTFWGPALIGLEDAWSWIFYGRSWLARQVKTALEANRPTRAG